MRITAAVLNAPGTPLVIEPLEIEAPRDREIRVRLVATGVCHTDISVMGRPFPVDQPIVLGHEGAGVVESVGSAVTKVQVGDRVVLSYNFCGACPSCLRHAPSYCRYFFGSNFLGQRRDGSTALSRDGQPVRHHFFGQSSFATHCLCTEQNVVKVPDSVPHELFELLGPLGCGIQTGAGAIINVLKPQMGESVVVFGTGAVGMAGLMAARAIGAATIVAVDRVADRLALAAELGATHTVLADGDTDVVARIRELTGGGADCSLDTTAVSAVLRQALDGLGPLGRCGFVGGAPVGTQLEVDVRDVMLNGKTLRGIVEGDANADAFIPDLIRLQAQGRFPFEKLMKIYPFESIHQAMADARAGSTVKPVLRMPA
ncbi:NAD(P)-dependent alcohol dehydrogenase [Aquabacterium sp. A08]|uniref:NAD(P)-dependent alcohol dehydrogenase n=1 Tax=Aquabacterium sp. A08 TaxID=2718532 RepID=UPI00141E498D|nr:NAD(P)-dependent alcohol dehydrogenase [Aquabacterium sp. A08]NIC42860.1 NAD(P)-dependent alcohol dehydrogenase [Aquabacterium sp. A08]